MHRKPIIALELSMFACIVSEIGLTYGMTMIFLLISELAVSKFLAIVVLCTKIFFNLKFILSKIRFKG